MKQHHRTTIRRYIQALLLKKMDMGKRIFTNRPSPRFLETLPCVCIHYGPEPANIWRGDEYNVDEYERKLTILVDIILEEQLRPDMDIEENMDAEDLLDSHGLDVENAMDHDHTLGRLLDDWDDETGEGLSMGSRLISVDPYKIGEDADREIIAQRLTFEVPYLSETILNLRLPDFLYYRVDINKPGFEENTVDPELISAEGTVRNGTN